MCKLESVCSRCKSSPLPRLSREWRAAPRGSSIKQIPLLRLTKRSPRSGQDQSNRGAMKHVETTTRPSETTSERPDVEVTLHVNGEEYRLRFDARVTLLDALRDHLGLTGAKKGCDQ